MSVEPRVMEHVRSVLESFENKYLDDKGTLKRTRIIEDLDAYDEHLMTALLSDTLIHSTYTKELAGVEIFEVNQFIQMLEFKEYWEDSYTKYSNTIGLTAGGKFIDESEDVVLDFPFKDTILKAGMSKEDLDKDESADEPFLNEVIAKPEIDELLEPKVFVNAKRYDADGEHDANSFVNTDNLIIKGNNLIALYSLKKRYEGKIKLIYLDPPYNTGNDSFLYNDSFNQSSWLTFMKNRLEIAKELLSNNGIIAIHLDDSEGPYLKVLMDSIFGRNNELFTQYILVRYASKTLKSDMNYHKQIEQIHFYKKDTNAIVTPNKTSKLYDYSKFNFEISVKGNPEKVLTLGNKKVEVFNDSNVIFNKVKGNKKGLKEIWATGTILNGNSSGRFFRDYLDGRFKEDGYGVVYRVYGIGDDGNDYRYFTGPKRAGATKGKYYQGVPLEIQEGKIKTKKLPVPGFLDLAGSFGNDRLEGGVELRNGKKPEKLLSEVIKTFSNNGDFVLDFFGGSGTTAATAYKMQRHFITIEQMNSQIKKILTRLNNVKNGDQTGISKDVNWQGGGSFVYAELMEKNGGFVHDVKKAANSTELLAVFDRMKNTADFDFRVDLDKFATELANFKTLEKQKRELFRILDKNQLYYNYANIDDTDVRDLISDNDYQFKRSFYGNVVKD